MFRKSTKKKKLKGTIRGKPDDETGDVVTAFKAKYYGSVTVEVDRGADVVLSAIARVKHQKNDPLKVLLVVKSQALLLIDRRTADVIQNSQIADVTFAGISSTDGKLFSYITRSKAGPLYCHVFQVKERARELSAAVAEVMASQPQRTPSHSARPSGRSNGRPASTPAHQQSVKQVQSPARSASIASPETSIRSPLPDRNSVQAPRQRSASQHRHASEMAYDCEYLGHELVTEKEGSEAVGMALKTKERQGLIAANNRRRRGSKRGTDTELVTLIVTPYAIKTVERFTGEEIFSDFISKITFTCTAKTSRSGDVFAYISTDERLGNTVCHLFKIEEGKSAKVCAHIGRAFKEQARREKEQGENPFAVTDRRREPVKGKLFRRQIHRAHLKSIKPIGAGQFGEVYLAWQEIPARKGENGKTSQSRRTQRAVKLLKNAAKPEDKAEFLREAEAMVDLVHPHLVTFVGVALQQKPWLCVLEYMKYGDLRSVLRAMSDKDLLLDLSEQLDWCKQLASGMTYLAACRLVHMDLAARNCMLTDANVVKIGDFGLTRRLEDGKDYVRIKERVRLPLKWISLEGMEYRLFSESSDVWSFGVLMWEIFNYGETPYPGVHTKDIQQLVKDGLRLDHPDGCPDNVFALMSSCWDLDRRSRPTFRSLKDYLSSAHAQLPNIPARDVGHELNILRKQGRKRTMSLHQRQRPNSPRNSAEVSNMVPQTSIRNDREDLNTDRSRSFSELPSKPVGRHGFFLSPPMPRQISSESTTEDTFDGFGDMNPPPKTASVAIAGLSHDESTADQPTFDDDDDDMDKILQDLEAELDALGSSPPKEPTLPPKQSVEPPLPPKSSQPKVSDQAPPLPSKGRSSMRQSSSATANQSFREKPVFQPTDGPALPRKGSLSQSKPVTMPKTTPAPLPPKKSQTAQQIPEDKPPPRPPKSAAKRLAPPSPEKTDTLKLSKKSEKLLQPKTGTMLFNKQEQQHSRIFQALNRKPLWFETARERQEKEDTIVDVGALESDRFSLTDIDTDQGTDRDEDAYGFDGPSSSAPNDQDDDDDEQEESEDDEDFENMDFGVETDLMLELRRKREEEAEKRRLELREKHLREKEEEKRRLNALVADIKEKEAEQAKQNEAALTKDLEEAKKRAETELTFSFTFA